MLEEMWKNSAIITKRNVDSNKTPISIPLTELKQVIDVHSCIVLNQLPDKSTGIDIEGFSEVEHIDDLTEKTIKVDYDNGVIYFHPFNVGKTLTVNYSGIGYTLISASRVYTKYDREGNVLETLEELIDRVRLQLDAIEHIGGAIEIIEKMENMNTTAQELHESLVLDMKNAKEANDELNNSVIKGNDTAKSLEQRITLARETNLGLANTIVSAEERDVMLKTTNATAQSTNTTLNNTITKAQNTNTTLNQTNTKAQSTNTTLENTITKVQEVIASAQDDIAIIESTGNETITVLDKEWTYNDSSKMYEKEITHNCASENIHITCKTTDTKEVLFLPWRIVDKSKILLKSDEMVGCTIVLNARYYRPLNLEKIDEEEIISARENKSTLLENMIRKINYEDFNGNTID